MIGDDLSEIAKPDAVLIPAFLAPRGEVTDQAKALYEQAKTILGVEKPIARDQGEHKLYTLTLADTLLFPTSHRRHPESRYRWETQENGIRYGYYVDGANEL